MRFARSLCLAAAALAPSCSSSDAQRPSGNADTCPNAEVLVAASDYTSSMACSAPGPCASGADLGADPTLAASGGRVFFLARDQDAVFELDPSCGRPVQKLNVSSLAARPDSTSSLPANPHDVAAAPDGALVVTLYSAAKLAFFRDGHLDGEPLDLSSYDDDRNPQAESVAIVDVDGSPKAFVALERLDDATFRSVRTSQMLRIDLATRQVESVVDLAGRNPFNGMSVSGPTLYLAEPGDLDKFREESAGIERFDTASMSSRLVVREADIGASIVEVSVTDGCGVAIVAGAEPGINPTSVISFDPETGNVLRGLDRPLLGPTPGYDFQGLAWQSGALYVGDRRRTQEGYEVHVLERTGACELRDSGRSLPLPQKPVALRAARKDTTPSP